MEWTPGHEDSSRERCIVPRTWAIGSSHGEPVKGFVHGGRVSREYNQNPAWMQVGPNGSAREHGGFGYEGSLVWVYE